jgi:hypothetical protein
MFIYLLAASALTGIGSQGSSFTGFARDPLQGGYDPIIQQQGTPAPLPPPPTYPVPLIPHMAQAMDAPFVVKVDLGSEGNFSESSMDYELSAEVVSTIVNGVVTSTRPLQSGESISATKYHTVLPYTFNVRSNAGQPTPGGKVRHGYQEILHLEGLDDKIVRLQLTRKGPGWPRFQDPYYYTFQVRYGRLAYR